MRIKVIAVAAAVLASAPAVARVDYAAYEGPDAVQVGTGGTKIVRDGVDFWTSGTPPHRYQVLGVLSDRRSNRLWDGNAIGSSDLARRTRELGGNGLIVMGENRQDAGFVGGWMRQPYGGTFVGRHRVLTTTQFVVVRYLSDN